MLRQLCILALASGIGLLSACARVHTPDEAWLRAAQKYPDDHRARSLNGTFGTYNAAPRKPDGHVDIDRLLAELAELKANTYHWLIWHSQHDWEDLQAFLPRARANGLRVWVTLVPPSESPPRTKMYSEPFRTDYLRWAEEIGQLARREPNLVAWSIDDFGHNLKVFTPETTRDMTSRARAISPHLAFVPCIYYKQMTPEVARDYGPSLDGVLFPYRHESGGANLTDASQVEAEVKRLRELLGPDKPIIVDVYATAHSRLGASTPQYVREVMLAAGRSADGLHVYCHQDPVKSPEKYAVIKDVFGAWAERGFGRNP